MIAPHQQRVIDEKAELDARRERLLAFIVDSEIYTSLDSKEKTRLRRQLLAMNAYSYALGDRIEAFESAQ